MGGHPFPKWATVLLWRHTLQPEATQQTPGGVDPRQIIPRLPLRDHAWRVASQRVAIHKLDTQQRHGDTLDHQLLCDGWRATEMLREFLSSSLKKARYRRPSPW